MLFAANCGGSSGQSNPPPPIVVMDADDDLVDVGQRFFLDATGSTDPNGNSEDLEFLWRITAGGNDDTKFDDHCREDFDEICTENDDDHCSNDTERFCHEDSDCLNLGTCDLNSGTTSSQCTTGLCGLEEGDELDHATFVANVAGPFEVRVTAIGNDSNGTATRTFDTFPSLYLIDTIYQFGGTEGAFLGEAPDADEFANDASEGASDPANGNLVVIDDELELVRVFDLKTGEVVGPFGESDRVVKKPVALAFHPDNDRLFIAEAAGRVLQFDDATGLLINVFTDIGPGAVAMKFNPETGSLLVVYGNTGTGVREFDEDGNALGVLGETDTAVTNAVDIDFLGDDLLIADSTGRVVRCGNDGNDCVPFSSELDDLLAAGSPTAIAVNPSQEFTNNDVMVADPVAKRVITCRSNGTDCATFGDTDDGEIDSSYRDVFFSPGAAPTTTTSTTSTTTTTLP
jgi:DNA-binding beta-propeller fold protein YncE